MSAILGKSGFRALVVLLLGGGFAYFLLVGKPEPTPRDISPPQLRKVDVVSVVSVQRSLSVRTQGTVRPLREVKVVSQVGGRVESVSPHFSQGSFFAAQEKLIQIEDVDYQLQIARAESMVAAARQTLAEEKGRALQAKREWRNLGSEEANDLFLRKPQIAAAQAALKAAEADLQAARLDLQRTGVSVPFNGRISEKLVDAGQFVAPGTHVATVYATDAVEIRLPLTGRQVALLDLPLNYDDNLYSRVSGSPVKLHAAFANREWEWEGRVVRTDASIDESSRVVYAVAEVDKPFARDPTGERPPLSPGLFVNAIISGREIKGIAELPASALLSDDVVLVVAADGYVHSQAVTVMDRNSRQVWVQGLDSGQKVVVGGATLALSGTQVEVNPVEKLATGL
jgi:RND family efflux transporter MFP subunit